MANNNISGIYSVSNYEKFKNGADDENDESLALRVGLALFANNIGTKNGYLKTTDPDGVTIFNNWVKGVASVGTFYYYSNSTWLAITQDFKNESCIPSGWTVVKGN